MKIAPFRYSGRKLKYVDQINSIYNSLFGKLNTEELIYVEPFCGSASVFFNLSSKFKRYIISDLDRNVIRIHKSIKECPYLAYIECQDNIMLKFGDISQSKDAYYSFRKYFNDVHFGKDTGEEGLYLQILFGACINSMARLGPNGFNQGYGNRISLLSMEEYNSLQERLSSAELYNMSFEDLKEDILSELEEHELFMFLDPPYILRELCSYKNLEQHQYDDFIRYLKRFKGKFIYTDIYDAQLDMQSIVLRENMLNTKPSSKKEKLDNKEVAFYNFTL